MGSGMNTEPPWPVLAALLVLPVLLVVDWPPAPDPLEELVALDAATGSFPHPNPAAPSRAPAAIESRRAGSLRMASVILEGRRELQTF